MIDYGYEISRLRDLIESGVTEYFYDEGDFAKELRVLPEAMNYTLASPGKRIRPVLLLLSCKAAGGEEADALRYAYAIEFIHNYSLIHDDLPAMDDDDLRRGRPTNHKVYGEAMAILAGDGLLSAAFEVLFRECACSLDDAEDDAETLRRRVRAGLAIAEGCGRSGMVAGQAVDILAEGKEPSAELLDFIHIKKTAALIRAAAEAGAWLGGAAPELVQCLAEYGEQLGLAFQIADDILDFEGETGTIGKTAGKDARAGKTTYPAVHGIEASRRRLSEHTERAIAAAEAAAGEGADAQYIAILRELAQSLEKRVK